MRAKSKVIVIIACYNGRQYWPDLMPWLSREHYADFDLEILVVDNNSSDDSVGYLREHFPKIKIIINPTNLGFVGANNIGYQYACRQKADYIYLLNQDTVIRPGWLQPLYDFARHNKFGTLQSKILLWPDTSRVNTLGNVIHFLGFGYGQGCGRLDQKKNEIKKINYASGAGVLISLEAWADFVKAGQAGGGTRALFDETMFMYLEDLDLGWTMSLLGYDNYLVPDSIIYHKYQFNRSMRHYYWLERNRLWVMMKNYQWPTMLLILPAYLLMELGQLFYASKNGRLGQKLKSYSFLFSSQEWQELLARRRQIQRERRRSDRTVAGHFSGVILFQELSSPVLAVANVFFYIYWTIIKQFIFW